MMPRDINGDSNLPIRDFDPPLPPVHPTHPPVVRPPRDIPTTVVQATPASNFSAEGVNVGSLGGFNIPIESRVARAIEDINDGATKDLRDIVGKVESNRLLKEQMRICQRFLEEYKMAVNNNDSAGASAAKGKLLTQLQLPADKGGLGLPPDSAEVVGATKLPTTLPADAADRDKLISGDVASMGTLLDSRAQSLSDLSAKFQIQLTEANNIFQRTMNLQATLLKSNNDTLNNIVQKMG